MPGIKRETTYSFDQENILQLLAEYLNDKFGEAVKPKDFSVSISDSSSGYGDYEPARIRSISITVPTKDAPNGSSGGGCAG